MKITITLALLLVVTASRADSLFPLKKVSQATRTSGLMASLYDDNRAHAVGDTLTIIIAESTTASASADSKLEQDENISGLSGTGLFQRLFKDLSFSAGSNRTANGSGQTDRSGTLTTTLSVLVKEVLPNGTLRIEGSRMVGINKETQKVTFTGIVRPEDIAQDNSIPSSMIAGVEVKYDGKGIVADTAKTGILTRLFKFLF